MTECETCGNSYCREQVVEYKVFKRPENCDDWKPYPVDDQIETTREDSRGTNLPGESKPALEPKSEGKEWIGKDLEKVAKYLQDMNADKNTLDAWNNVYKKAWEPKETPESTKASADSRLASVLPDKSVPREPCAEGEIELEECRRKGHKLRRIGYTPYCETCEPGFDIPKREYDNSGEPIKKEGDEPCAEGDKKEEAKETFRTPKTFAGFTGSLPKTMWSNYHLVRDTEYYIIKTNDYESLFTASDTVLRATRSVGEKEDE